MTTDSTLHLLQQQAGSRWHDWQWQMKNRIDAADALARFTALSEGERVALAARVEPPFSVTPYYLDVILGTPLRQTVIPQLADAVDHSELIDPLGEEAHKVTSRLIHTYPDKALLLVTDTCATYCRYCTRKRRVGNEQCITGTELHHALSYLKAHREIRDILISGGDPLLLQNQQLDHIIGQIRTIPHIEIVRIGTKVPMTLPQRITPKLCKILKKHQPIWVSIHCTHSDEWTPHTQKAVARLVDSGLPCISQTVLLHGVNDDSQTIKTLMQRLLRNRIKPYYLFLPDLVRGITPFRIPLDHALAIVRDLHGFTSGLAVPTLMIDAPGGGGKIPLLPDYVIRRETNTWVLRNYQGNEYRYPDHLSDPQK